MNYTIIIDRELLTISYCDPVTLETIKYKQFKTIDELETFIIKKKSFDDI